MTVRLAAVVSHPIQHFAPMFRDLARRPEVDLKVFYCCDWGVKAYRDPGFGRTFAWDVPLLEGYAYEFLPIRRRPKSLSFLEIDNPGITERLDAFHPYAVWVHGYSHRTSWRVHRWARNRAHIIHFGDSELVHKRRPLAKLLKRMILPWFFRHCDAFITIGDNNEDYYRYYGVPNYKMFRGAFPVDISRFRRSIRGLTPEDRERTRGRFGLKPDSVVVLFVGKLIPIKRPLDLVEAMARLKTSDPAIEALFVGDGEMRGRINSRIETLGLGDRVKTAGFVNQSEIPVVLHAGDVLAVCSEKDPHPLAITEAMAVGHAIVASDRVGCVGPTDAARPEVNALVYPCGDIDQLASRLHYVATDAGARARMSQASRELALTQDTSVTVSAVLRAIESFGKRADARYATRES